jgi:hypothetical protein
MRCVSFERHAVNSQTQDLSGSLQESSGQPSALGLTFCGHQPYKSSECQSLERKDEAAKAIAPGNWTTTHTQISPLC